MESVTTMEDTEQPYKAELLRDRARARADEAAAEAEELEETSTNQPRSSREPRINPITGAFWAGLCFIIDMIQFIATATISIPIIGWVTGPLAYVLGWVVSLLMAIAYIFWFLWIGISLTSKEGVLLYSALFGAVLGESVIGFLPVWTGFAIWVTFKLSRPHTLQQTGKST